MSSTRKILELNAFDMKNPAGLPAEMEFLVARRQKTFGPTSMLFYKRPLHIVRAEGVWLHCAGNGAFSMPTTMCRQSDIAIRRWSKPSRGNSES